MIIVELSVVQLATRRSCHDYGGAAYSATDASKPPP